MTDEAAEIAPTTTRLGLLQRGRGAGFVAAIGDGSAAHEDLLHCILTDPRIDRQIEARARFYAELAVATDLPLAQVAGHLAGSEDEELGHEVLAAAWCMGQPQARELLLAHTTDEALLTGITSCLWGARWATLVELPPRAAAIWLRLDLDSADSTRSAVRPKLPTALEDVPLLQLLELARDARLGRRDRLLGELCARGDAATRDHLVEVVTTDVVFERVRLAGRALGLLGDERLLPLAEELFAREDVFEDPRRRLPGLARMRRSCLSDYVQHLPAARALALARDYHQRGGYFETVAGFVFQEHATAADRTFLETFVSERRDRDGGWDVIAELDALGRLADPRSAPLLAEVAAEAAYSHARRRALRALAAMPQVAVAQTCLREALWDCEDEAADYACQFLPSFDGQARARLATIADSPLADEQLTVRARRRLQRAD